VDLLLAPTLLFPGRSRIPVVVTIHDTVPWTHPETLTSRGALWHRASAERAAREAAAVLVPTHAVAAEVVKLLQVPSGLVHVAPGAPSAALLNWTPDRPAPSGLPKEYVLSLATLEPRKGLDVLIRAMAHPDGPPLPLVVVGRPGWGGVDPAQLARAAGLDPARLVLLGHVSDGELAATLRQATVLAVPSRAEGFGLPVVEAMAVGTPVVISAVPALQEVASGAAAEVSVEDVEGWARTLHDVATAADLRENLRDSGLCRAQDFRWSSTARRLWELFEALVL
jgi:glycosyltransferase involved in cell wall biosynthesis